MATNVVVADSATIFRAAVRSLLEREGDLEVAEASNRDELLAVVRADSPAVALIDVDLPPWGGLEALSAVTSAYGTRCILWSLEPNGKLTLEALRAQACGVLPKHIGADALARALRGASQGETALPRSLTSVLVHELQALARRQRAREYAGSLSERECGVLSLVAAGCANKEIAAELFISEFTVKRHIHNILGKLGQRSRAGAAAVFLQAQEDEEAPWLASNA
jgi:DNA-binding NarL/FixJ family response regulator